MMRRSVFGILAAALCVVLSVPAGGFAMGSGGSCDDPEGRTYSAGDEYSVPECGYGRGTRLVFKCVASGASNILLGADETPVCSVDYNARIGGSGKWEKPVGESHTMNEPRSFRVRMGTIKVTRTLGFY